MEKKQSFSEQFRIWILPLALLVGISLVWLSLVQTSDGGKLFRYLDVLIWVFPHLLLTLLIATVQHYYHTIRVFNTPNLASACMLAVLGVLAYYSLASTFSWNDVHYQNYVWAHLPLRTAVSLLYFLLVTALFWVEQENVRGQRIRLRAVEKEREATRIELNTLQQQFKPHFLFNSLNSINALTISKPEEARRMVHLLSEFMRAAVRENQSELVSFANEIHHIQLYTEIEKVRFGERLQVKYVSDEAADSAKLPSLILQPLIENAVKFGLYGQTETVTIEITAKMVEAGLRVTISNPYDAELEPKSIGTGFGLSSVEKKMWILYQQNSLVKIERREGIFRVTLTIPQS